MAILGSDNQFATATAATVHHYVLQFEPLHFAEASPASATGSYIHMTS